MARIAFYKAWGDTWYNKLYTLAVRVWTFGKYTHVELINDDISACPKEWCWYSASAFKEGIVRVKNIDIRDGHWDIFALNSLHSYEAFEFMKGEIGKKYDFAGVFWSIIARVGQHRKKKWFCSEIVRAALCEGDLFYCKNTGATDRRVCQDVCQSQFRCDKKSALCDNRHHNYSPNRLFKELKTKELI